MEWPLSSHLSLRSNSFYTYIHLNRPNCSGGAAVYSSGYISTLEKTRAMLYCTICARAECTDTTLYSYLHY